MKNYIAKGHVIEVVAGLGGVAAGDFVLIGSVPAVAITSAAEGDTYTAQCEGVFEVVKATGAITQGAKLYWDATAKNITTTATSNTLAGWAYAAAASADATVQIKLNESV